MSRGKIIVIEGTDGSGKETQSKKLYEYFINKGLKVKRYSFPIYGSPTGKIVGGPYLGKHEICESFFPETAPMVDPLVSSLYYAADRRYNFLKDIEDDLYSNDILILDRYTTSNMGHQGSKAKSKKEMKKILKFIEHLEFDLCELPRPDLVIFLHMPFEAARDLRKDRTYGDGNENSETHLRNAEKTYIEIAKLQKWLYINCIKSKKYNNLDDIKSIDEISHEIIEATNNSIERNDSNKRMTRYI